VTDDSAFDDPDRCIQIEDDDPQSLAGDPVIFNPDADDSDDGTEAGGVQ
jgi:hypothetical protein